MMPFLPILTGVIIGLNSHLVVAKEQLTVLTAYQEPVVAQFETAFEQRYPDIDVQILWRMPHDALPYLSQPQQSGIDVYWSASQKNFQSLKQLGAWQKLAIDRSGLADNLGALPLTDPDDQFCVSEIAGYGFAINPDYLQKKGLPTPKTWQDLADARYQNHLALPIPSKVGFAPMMIDSVLQQYGWEQGWTVLAGIVANAKLADAGSTFITDIIGSAERGIAPTIDFFTASAIANGAPLQFVYPEPTAYSPAHIAITASSQHVDAARQFVSFVLSEAGQKLLFHPDIRKLPVRASVYQDKPTGYYDPFAAAAQHPVVYNPDSASPRLALNNALFDLMFAEHLPRLQTLWQTLRTLEQSANPAQLAQLAKIRALLTAAPIEAEKAQDAALLEAFSQRRSGADRQDSKQLETTWAAAIKARYASGETLLHALQ